MITSFAIGNGTGVIVTTLERVSGKTRRLFNLSGSLALTSLRNQGGYSAAYQGIDYLAYAENVQLAETRGWQDLRFDHPSGEWAATHSVLLT